VVGGVLSYAAELGVASLVIAGEVFDDGDVADALASAGAGAGVAGGAGAGVAGVGGGVTVVSLVERFGVERAMTDTTAGVAEVVADHLVTPG